MFNNLFNQFHTSLSVDWAIDLARKINEVEKYFTFKNFHKSAKICFDELKKIGLNDVRLIPVQCDGTQKVWDTIMPQAWDVKEATLDIMEPESEAKRLADYKKHPFHIGMFSGPTPKEGIEAEVILEEEMYIKDARGKIILHLNSRDPCNSKKGIEEVGAIGVINDWSMGGSKVPDGICWVNSYTSGTGWYSTLEEKPAFCFSISPNQGKYLRRLVKKYGTVKVRAVVKSKFYSDSFDIVTGVIKGTDFKDEEIVLLAHLYEPLPTDNATGGAGLIEIAKTLQNLINSKKISRPKRSIRFLLSWELYGFMAYFKKREKYLDRILGAVNMDSIALSQKYSNSPLLINLNPVTEPVFHDIISENIAKTCLKQYCPEYRWEVTHNNFASDSFMSDPSLGIPLYWPLASPGRYHHNSMETFEAIDPRIYHAILSITTTYAYFLANAGKNELHWLIGEMMRYTQKKVVDETQKHVKELSVNTHSVDKQKNFFYNRQEYLRDAYYKRVYSMRKFFHQDFKKAISYLNQINGSIDSLIKSERKRFNEIIKTSKKKVERKTKEDFHSEEKIASNMIPTRRFKGFLMDMLRVPKKERKRGFHFSEYFSYMDGKRSLYEISKLVSIAHDTELDPKKLRRIISFSRLLDKYGYLDIKYKTTVTKKQIKRMLMNSGIKKGDILFVHSSLSSLGNVAGGADSVITVLKGYLGRNGTLIMPTFSRADNIMHSGLGEVKGIKKPFDVKTDIPETGKLADTFWRQKDVLRSLHPTHSVAVWGKYAREFVEGHDERCSPNSKESVFWKLFKSDNAFLMFLGVNPGCMTFLHFFEDQLDLPCLQTARVLIKKDREVKEIIIPKFPIGPKDFYRWDTSKIKNRLEERKVRGYKKLKLGLGSVEIFSVKNLSRVLLDIFSKEVDILISDNPECGFSKKAKYEIKRQAKKIKNKIKELRKILT